MANFKPTWLYIKKHNTTGLQYFGKTTEDDPIKYPGSGLYWRRHLKKYGNDVSTIWAQIFENKSELTEYAIRFSVENNIVESDIWANIKIEDGLMGGNHDRFTPEGRKTLSEKAKNHRHSEESIDKIRQARKTQPCPRLGKKHSEETKQKLREARQKQVITPETKLKISESLKRVWDQRKINQEM